MTIRRSFIAGALAAVLLASTTYSAQGSGECEPFTVISDGSSRTVEFVDVGANGPGPGDQRIGYRALADQDGNPVGHYRWIVTVLNEPGEDGTPGESFYDYVMVLDDGHIGYNRLVQTSSPAQDTGQIAWDTTQAAIVTGGTGSYARASGTVTISRDGMTVMMDLDIACGD